MKAMIQWLYPGLKIKRWMLLFAIGLLLLVFGITMVFNYQIFGLLEEEILRVVYQLTGSYSYTALALWGILIAIIGSLIMLYATRRMVKRFIALVVPDEQNRVSQQVLGRFELSKGPYIAAIGGGHGLSMLLRGLKNKTSNLAAIVTVADDGGSSGRLREEMDIIAPGDLRNCLVAMADKESVLEQLFQYRFGGSGELAGHSLGNLFIAALIKEFGNAENALEAASKVLKVRGKVIPSTGERVRLAARMDDGVIVEGESEISAYEGHIDQLTTIPKNPRAVGDALEAISEADLILLGPGSLYTSIMPNLLVPEILEAIKKSSAPCMYICNVMTQPGETPDYTVGDHLEALKKVVGDGVINYVLANQQPVRRSVLEKYKKAGSVPVKLDREKVERLGATLISCDLLGDNAEATHDSDVLADKIIQINNLLRANISSDSLNAYLKGLH
jgi:uncharacterized cofD-like protein